MTALITIPAPAEAIAQHETPEQTPLVQIGGLMKRYLNASVRVAAIKEKAASDIVPWALEMAGLAAIIEDLATKHRAELFGTTKTLGLEFGELQFRMADKKLILPEGLNEKWYLQAVKDAAPGAIDVTVNDKRLLAALAALPDLNTALVRRGIAVEQKENFLIKPKKEAKKAK